MIDWIKILAAALILTWCVYPNALALAYAWLNPSPEDWMRKARRLRDARNVRAAVEWMAVYDLPGDRGYVFGSGCSVTPQKLGRWVDEAVIRTAMGATA